MQQVRISYQPTRKTKKMGEQTSECMRSRFTEQSSKHPASRQRCSTTHWSATHIGKWDVLYTSDERHKKVTRCWWGCRERKLPALLVGVSSVGSSGRSSDATWQIPKAHPVVSASPSWVTFPPNLQWGFTRTSLPQCPWSGNWGQVTNVGTTQGETEPWRHPRKSCSSADTPATQTYLENIVLSGNG